MSKRCSLLAMWAGLTASPALAQEPHEIVEGFLEALTVAWSAAHTRCVTTFETGFTNPAADSGCRVVDLTALGTAGGTEWHLARYRRYAVILDSAYADTMDVDELVLLGHAPGAADARVAWHLVRDRDYEFLDTLYWAPTSHAVFLDLRICLNGTGGCRDEYLRWDGAGWRVITQPFVRRLHERLPADHWLHKGRRLDLETLTGIWPVSAPGDANCCPSLEIPFAVRLVRDAMVLDSAGPLRPASIRE